MCRIQYRIPITYKTRNTCMQQPLAYIFQTLFQHEVFVILQKLTQARVAHIMLAMATR
jgi:hypothetical protein